MPRASVDVPDARILGSFLDRIAFEEAGFRYPGAEEWALRDISLTVRKGEMVAFVGMSGAGKTTLMELLLRFHDVSAGRITIDGHDVRAVTGDLLLALMWVVSQETLLFQNSIGFNIAYGKPGAAAEEIERAARMAQAMEFITGVARPVCHPGGRTRGPAVGRPGPATHHRSRVPERPSHPDPRRGHLCPRRRERVPRPTSARRAHEGTDRPVDRSSDRQRQARGSHHRRRRGSNRGNRSPRRADGASRRDLSWTRRASDA